MNAIDAWRARGAWFDYRGQPVFYVVEGQGAPLICIHGFPTASWDWSWIWHGLVEHFTVVAPDMMGFGFTAKPRAYAYSLRDQATLHEALLERLGIAEVHLLAHDYGDSVAQELLARHEERADSGAAGLRIRSVCFLNGGLFPAAHRPRPIQKLLASPFGALIGKLMNERSFRKSFSEIFGPDTQPGEAELRGFWHLIAHNDGRAVMHKLIRYMDERRRFETRWVGAMKRTRVPLRFINGALDPISGRHMADAYRATVPNPDVVSFDRIGHYPQVEAPDAVLRAFLDFHAACGRK